VFKIDHDSSEEDDKVELGVEMRNFCHDPSERMTELIKILSIQIGNEPWEENDRLDQDLEDFKIGHGPSEEDDRVIKLLKYS